jgi:tetratricopeptide (TPR) repeat protein
MKIQISIIMILILGVCAGSAQQPAMQAMPVMPASSQDAVSKAVTAALQEKDMAKRAEALEAIIRDNPNSPQLSVVYSVYLSTLTSVDRDKAAMLADDLLVKFPDPKSPIRRAAYSNKFSALRIQKKTEEIHSLAQKVLDIETDPLLLLSAAGADDQLSAKLFEKAIAERAKDKNANASPNVDDLRWQYAQSLLRTPRKEEGMKMMQEVIDAGNKTIDDAEKLPAEDPARRRAETLKRTMGSRYQSLSRTLSEAGEYDKALQYLDLSIPKDPTSAFEGRSSNELLRADIYAKMNKPDLQMDSYAKAFAARMDKSISDKINELAKKTGADPEKVYDRARKLRKEGAMAIKPFELKSIEGKVTTLASAKGKVTLVNFFFPT